MKFNLKQEEKELFALISHFTELSTIDTYIVGGYVRDKLLGKNNKDIDFCCVGNCYTLIEYFKQYFPNIQVSIFKNFGTASILFKGFSLEFVSARKESYIQSSRNPKVVEGTFEEDISRRDFTINTLAISLQKDNYFEIIDLFNGQKDLEKKILKTPLNPDETFFDDPLRMMRAIRFATQLEFEIETTVFKSIQKNAKRIDIVAIERVKDELEKIILSKKPSIGFELLYKAGLLEILLPELTSLIHTEEVEGNVHKNNFYHTLKVLDNVAVFSDDLKLRWAAILHDIGKSVVKKYDSKIGWTFHGHEFVSAKRVDKIFKRLSISQKEFKSYVQKIISLHHRPISLTKEETTDSAIRRLIFEAGDDIEDLINFCIADITTKNEKKKQQYSNNLEFVKKRFDEVEEKDKIRNWKNPITGDYIMQTFGISPSKVIGDLKLEIREAILDGKIKNNVEEAQKHLLELAKQKGINPPKLPLSKDSGKMP